ncbi:MAG: protein kinase [Myxococcales bacterium]|nr:protein kinase [Myxococcales bacterium]
MFAPGQILSGTYQVERLLGSGGMADVYLVRHTRLPRHFALKVLKLELKDRPELIERFRREAEVLARLRSPYIVSVVDMNQTEDGWPFLVMDYLEGSTLAEKIKTHGPLPIDAARRLFEQLCEGVLAAHELGVIHRDLKPSNVFLQPGPRGERVQILDFGIAKLCEEGLTPLTRDFAILGTPGYMAPEQVSQHSGERDFRIDQFALGAILYEMLSGQPAFFQRGEPILRIVQRLINEQPAPVAESQLSPIVRRMLRKDPAERYPSLHELLHELRELPTDPQALIRAKSTREPTLSLPPLDPILTLPTDEQPTRLQDDLRPIRHSPAPSELSPAAFEQSPLLRRALWPTAMVLCVIGLGAVLLQRLLHRSPTTPIVTAQPVGPQPAPVEPLPPVQLAPQEKTVPQAKPAPAKPLLTVKPRVAQKLQRAFVITGATPSQEQLVRLCADKALGELPGLYATTIRLERSGALHLTQAPDVVYRSGFDACLRQAFHATTTPLPEAVTVRVLIQRPKL